MSFVKNPVKITTYIDLVELKVFSVIIIQLYIEKYSTDNMIKV